MGYFRLVFSNHFSRMNVKRILSLSLACLFFSSAVRADLLIETVNALFGDGGLATYSKLNNPYGIAADSLGNVFIAEYAGHRIRKIRADGVITTIAGTGSPGFSGDGGPALSAQFNRPRSIAVDPNGNVYVADTVNYRIRKITPAGIITTFAGNGSATYSGDGGPATSAGFPSVFAMAADTSENIYVADDDRVRKINAAGIVTTIAGGGSISALDAPALSCAISPRGLVYRDGHLYLSSTYSALIGDLNLSNGFLARHAGRYGAEGFGGDGGPALNAQFYFPYTLCFSPAGELFISDYGNLRVRKISTAGIITTVAGNGLRGLPTEGTPAASGRIGYPEHIAFGGPLNEVLIMDIDNDKGHRVDASGLIWTFCGKGADPWSLASNGPGLITITSRNQHTLWRLGIDTGVRSVAGDQTAGFSGDGGPAAGARLNIPDVVTVDVNGNTFFSDQNASRVRKVDSDGIITTVAGNGTAGYSGDGGPATAASITVAGLATDTVGNLYISGVGYIRRVNTLGIIETIAGGGTDYDFDAPATSCGLLEVDGLACFNRVLYVCSARTIVGALNLDTGYMARYAGMFAQQGYSGDGGPATSAKLNSPTDLAVDLSGNLYIADYTNFAIRKVTPAGIISTIAGDGINGYTGDGGPAHAARLSFIGGLTVDPVGNIFLSDRQNHLVRRIYHSEGGDVTPPSISGVAAGSVTRTAATITWTTDEPSDSQVEYGLTTAYGTSTPINGSLVTSHSMSLSGLSAGTLYHYRVKSRDAAGNLAVSGDFTFTTVSPDVTPPVISGVGSRDATARSARIFWTTNEPATTQVRYGLTTAYGATSPFEAALVTTHNVDLVGLTPNTLYHYQVVSQDADSNVAAAHAHVL